MKKIGLFGGTFNPIHYGHLRAATEAMEMLNLDKVVFIPSQNPPLKKDNIAPALDRFNMVETAIADNPHFIVSDIEARTDGPSFTALTIKELKLEMPQCECYFIMGMDTFVDLPYWYMPQILIDETYPVVLIRPPYSADSVLNSPFIDRDKIVSLDFKGDIALKTNVPLKNNRTLILLNIPQIDISGTQIRRNLSTGRSIKYLLPQGVEAYILSGGGGYI